MSCSLEHDQTHREERRKQFVETYGHEPTDKQLRYFIEYINWVKSMRSSC